MARRTVHRPRKGGSLRRRTESRAPKRTFLVFCEGTRTEPDYIEDLRKESAVRDSASVEIQIDLTASGAVPLTLVNAAAEARDRFSREQSEIDEVWCLFDVEWPRNHPNLREAREKANARNVRLAISNPCFELWLMLHFEDRTAWLDSDAARRLRCRYDGSSGKGLEGSKYMPRRTAAARHARALEAKHIGDGTGFPDDNPSSGMYLLLEAISPTGRTP